MKHYIAITENSVWLIETDDDFVRGSVVGRASVNSPLVDPRRSFCGPIITGPDGLNLRPGTRIVFRNVTDEAHDGVVTTSAPIKRLVQFADTPKASDQYKGDDGIEYITLNPSWHFLLPFIDGGQEVRANARRCFQSADLLTILVDMGRVTQQDLQDAKERGL